MKPVPSYLSLNRHGTYYFRIVIPAPVRKLLQGKREIRRSLKTDSQRLAVKRARQHAVRFESVFDRVHTTTTSPQRKTGSCLTSWPVKISAVYGAKPKCNRSSLRNPSCPMLKLKFVSGDAKSNAC
ncbi:DUF6538 domain-containing protein [Pseudomonas alliivorans]|nr:DUF6538 domain-containing protein [Pseudomonas alliivorans]